MRVHFARHTICTRLMHHCLIVQIYQVMFEMLTQNKFQIEFSRSSGDFFRPFWSLLPVAAFSPKVRLSHSYCVFPTTVTFNANMYQCVSASYCHFVKMFAHYFAHKLCRSNFLAMPSIVSAKSKLTKLYYQYINLGQFSYPIRSINSHCYENWNIDQAENGIVPSTWRLFQSQIFPLFFGSRDKVNCILISFNM